MQAALCENLKINYRAERNLAIFLEEVFMNKRKRVIILIAIILVLVVAFSMRVRVFFLNQIGDIFSESILNDNYQSEYISEKNKQKILDEIYSYENDDFKVKSVKCSYDDENWIEKYVWVSVVLETNDDERAEHYKCYFKIDKGKVYITEVGLNIADDRSVTDLD